MFDKPVIEVLIEIEIKTKPLRFHLRGYSSKEWADLGTFVGGFLKCLSVNKIFEFDSYLKKNPQAALNTHGSTVMFPCSFETPLYAAIAKEPCSLDIII